MHENTTSHGTNLIGFKDIKREPIKGWQEFLQEGKQFLTTAENAFAKNRASFTAEILYNLVAMAIEKLIMAQLMKSGNLPYNHTMHDLVEAMDEFLPGHLHHYADKLKALDGYQEICDTETFTIVPPTMAEVEKMLELAGEVKDLIMAQITD